MIFGLPNTSLSALFSSAGLVAVAILAGACSPKREVSWPDQVRSHLAESEGGSLVSEAIEAHGGMENWLGKGALQFRWKYNLRDRGPSAVVNTLQVVDPDSLKAYHVTPDGAVRFGWDGESYWVLPADAGFAPPPRFWTHTPFYFIGIPFVFGDLNARFEKLEEPFAFEGSDYLQVKVTYTPEAGDAPDDYYILLINPESKQVKGARYIVTSPLVSQGGPPVEKLITLDGLTDYDGVLLASGHRTFSMDEGVLGGEMRDTEISEVSWLDVDTLDFSMPEEAGTL